MRGTCSTRGEDGLALQGGSDGLIGADAAPRGGADDGADGGVEIGAPLGPEAAGDLAIGGGGTKFALAAVVVGGDLGVVEKGEEVLAQLAVAPSQSLSMPVARGERHDGIERVLEAAAVFAAGALRPAPM